MLSKNQIKLIRSLELKKNRKREGLFVAEGPKVVNDLLTAGYKARAIYSTNDQISDDDYSIKEQITEEELHRISFLQHPQQVLAVMEIPEVLAHVRVIYTDLVALLQGAEYPVYGTLLDGQDIYGEELSAHGIIVMGNEGNGISPEVRQLVSHRLLIPNYHTDSHTAESLNVAIATAITCAEFRRRTR